MHLRQRIGGEERLEEIGDPLPSVLEFLDWREAGDRPRVPLGSYGEVAAV
jgi:hypothetical protein